MAVAAMKAGQVERIILTRPAVEAGESLGFLPGDLKEKVDPYLRPVYDALYAVLGKEHTDRLMDQRRHRNCAISVYAWSYVGQCVCDFG